MGILLLPARASSLEEWRRRVLRVRTPGAITSSTWSGDAPTACGGDTRRYNRVVEAPINLVQSCDRDAGHVKDENRKIPGGCPVPAMFLERSRTADNRRRQLDQRPHPPQASAELGVFQDRDERVTLGRGKGVAPAKDAMIAEREAKDIDPDIPERIAHPVNPFLPRIAESKTAAGHSMICQRPPDPGDGVRGAVEVCVKKPQRVPARDRSAGVHLQGTSPAGRNHPIGAGLRDCPRAVAASAIDDDDLYVTPETAEPFQERAEEPSLIEDWNDDRKKRSPAGHSSFFKSEIWISKSENSSFLAAHSRLGASGFPGAIDRGVRIDSPQRPFQCRQVDRLREIHVEPGIVPAFVVRGGEVGADRDGRDARFLPANLRNEIVAVLIRQTDIAHDDIDLLDFQSLQARGSRIARDHLMAPAPENRGEGTAGVRMIFNEEDGTHGTGGLWARVRLNLVRAPGPGRSGLSARPISAFYR